MKVAPIAIICMACIALSGCSWVGQTAGKTQAKIERKAQDLDAGYHKGYEAEKAKTAPKQNEAEPSSSTQQ